MYSGKRLCTNGKLVVPVSVYHPVNSDNMVRLDAIIDTGADFSVIDFEVAISLGLPIVGSRNVKSVTTTAECPLFRCKFLVWISDIKAGAPIFVLEGFSIIGSVLGDSQCLIGLDILRQGELCFSGQKNEFVLSFGE